MAMLRIPDKYAQEQGGWKTDQVMKKIYTQTFPDERVQVGKTIDKYLKVLSIQRTAPNAKENLLPEELIKLLTERDPDGWYKSTERNYATRMQHDTKKAR